MAGSTETKTKWHRVADLGEIPEGRVRAVNAGARTLALVHFDHQWSAMDARCPHEGAHWAKDPSKKGPTDGRQWLCCPWHGWDFNPLTGMPPGGHEDAGQEMFEVEEREDGIYVAVEKVAKRPYTVTEVMVQTMVNWGVHRVFGMVGHSNLGLADALRGQEEQGALT